MTLTWYRHFQRNGGYLNTHWITLYNVFICRSEITDTTIVPIWFFFLQKLQICRNPNTTWITRWTRASRLYSDNPLQELVVDIIVCPFLEPVVDIIFRLLLEPVVDNIVRTLQELVVDIIVCPFLEPVVDIIFRLLQEPVVDNIFSTLLEPVVVIIVAYFENLSLTVSFVHY